MLDRVGRALHCPNVSTVFIIKPGIAL